MRSTIFFSMLASLLIIGTSNGANISGTRVPPAGKAISDLARAELSSQAEQLGHEIEKLRADLATKPSLRDLMPDVEIFHKAVDWAVRYDEVYRSNDVANARALLKQGFERARQLREGGATWLAATGLVVRGYVSKIDGSVQPYGLIVPATFATEQHRARRLDVWLHGRDNELTELKFMTDRQRSPGEFTPADTFVLHPYGRYCNAFKFAGETDVFEALEHVKNHYPIDTRRLALRGFSMGGAGAWHLAAHHPRTWAVAAPGAGFAETAEYTDALRKPNRPPEWEQRLWQLYDATTYARNFFNLPVVAYNGTEDKQRQAADMMEKAMRAEGLTLPRVWGTNVGHKYTPAAKAEMSAFVDKNVAGGKDLLPGEVHFTTRTLRYHAAPGVELLGMERHWTEARIDIDRLAQRITTRNVRTFALDLQNEGAFDVDQQHVRLDRPAAGSSRIQFDRSASGMWTVTTAMNRESKLRKTPALQGPIDDAFVDSFLIVRPTGNGWHQATADWIGTALGQATNDWRAQFRGHARVKDDSEVTEADIAAHNLILWGDPRSNRLLARIADRLPFSWTRDDLRLGNQSWPAAGHVLALIYPNPLNPKHYVVLNSGFTFAEAGAGSNAQQTPKLPDYAILAVAAPLRQKGTLAAGFFSDDWTLSIP